MGKIKKLIYSTSNEDKLEKTSIVLGAIPYAGSIISGSIQHYIKKHQEERLDKLLMDICKDLQEVKNKINLDSDKSVSKIVENLKITAIEIKNNKFISKDIIISHISSSIGNIFSKDKINKDIKSIYELGYFKDIKVKLETFCNGYKIIFIVEENLPIKEIFIEGNTIFFCEEIKKIMILQEGQIFSHKIFKNDLIQICELYKNRGYLLINIEDISFSKEGKLFIKITEGRIEKILIKGNIKIEEKSIAGEVNIFPGDLFCFKKIKKSLQKIYNLGYFENVTMRLEPGNKKESVILIINVFEKTLEHNKHIDG